MVIGDLWLGIIALSSPWQSWIVMLCLAVSMATVLSWGVLEASNTKIGK